MGSEVPDNAKLASAPPLLPRVAAGDAGAMRECVGRYGALVWTVARRFAPSEAEDAVQEIFLDLWRSAERFDARIASEPVFVVMIARRRLIDRRRRTRRQVDVAAWTELPGLVDPAAGPDVCAEASIAARALGDLPAAQREALVLATWMGMSHEEVAKRTGQPVGTVKSHLRRGLQRIRAALLGVEDEEESS